MNIKVLGQSPHGADDREGCAGCAGPGAAGSRRDFLRDTAALVAGTLVGIGLLPERARALPVEFGTPLGVDAEEITLALPTRDGAVVYKEQSLILARSGTAVYAFSLACPHQKAAVRWLDDQGRFQCSKHKSKYKPDGTYISGRATRSLDRFAVRRQGASVVVNLGRMIREDQDRAAWLAASVPVASEK